MFVSGLLNNKPYTKNKQIRIVKNSSQMQISFSIFAYPTARATVFIATRRRPPAMQ